MKHLFHALLYSGIAALGIAAAALIATNPFIY